MRFSIIKSSALCLVSSLLFFSFGCTSTPKGEVSDAVEADAGDVPDDEADAVDQGEGGNNELSQDDTQSNEQQQALENNAETAAPAETTPAPAPAPVAKEDRVVRYVMTDNTPAYEKADEKSKQVATYQTGDNLVVKLMGDWAEITDNYYIKTSALSAKLIPRKKLSHVEK